MNLTRGFPVRERLDILLEMTKEATKGRIERVYRVIKLSSIEEVSAGGTKE